MLLPLAAHMSAPAQRGKVLGQITGGLLTGVLLARPGASFFAGHFGWRAVYLADACIVAALTAWLSFRLPVRRPHSELSYSALLRSTRTLLKDHPELRRLSFAQAFLFAGFSLFWTGAPILLRDRLHIDDTGVALFALAGAAGALVAPLAGAAADRGRTSWVRLLALVAAGAGFAIGGAANGVWWLLLAALLVDAGVQACHVTAQRAIFALDATARSRLNSVYMTIFFLGGAVGSIAAAPLTSVGWAWTSVAGCLLVGLAALGGRAPALTGSGAIQNG
jgi:predicted MFS family arabinose efflux permease